jgi:glucuronoarabinoxylan endo-1,4-beta-xylanase
VFSVYGTFSRLRPARGRTPLSWLTFPRPWLLGPAAALALAVSACTASAPAGPGQAGAGHAAASAVTVNDAVRYQVIAGFGASEAFGQAQTLRSAPADLQRKALSLLYSPASGAGLTILRNEISADSGTTIEPTAPASPGAKPAYLPLSAIADDQGQLWLAQAIRKQYGVTNVFADAWSAPAFMKTNKSAINGGTLCGVPGATCASGDWRQAYANYLVQYAKDYAAAGIPLTYVGPENEADLSRNYDTMLLSPAQNADFLHYFGPALARSGTGAKVDCCASQGWDRAQQYAAAIEADPAAGAWTPLFTSHGYSQAPASRLAGWTKPVWETEWSTFETWDPAWDDGTAASGFTWAQQIYDGLSAANLNAFLYWWGSTTPSENGDNEGLLLLDTAAGTVTPSGRLWAFANYSRFVRPGAVRIGVSSADQDLEVVAFRNTDGSVAVVALNNSMTAKQATFAASATGRVVPYLTDASHHTAAQPPVPVSSGSFDATLPARSLMTFVIPAH